MENSKFTVTEVSRQAWNDEKVVMENESMLIIMHLKNPADHGYASKGKEIDFSVLTKDADPEGLNSKKLIDELQAQVEELTVKVHDRDILNGQVVAKNSTIQELEAKIQELESQIAALKAKKK